MNHTTNLEETQRRICRAILLCLLAYVLWRRVLSRQPLGYSVQFTFLSYIFVEGIPLSVHPF